MEPKQLMKQIKRELRSYNYLIEKRDELMKEQIRLLDEMSGLHSPSLDEPIAFGGSGNDGKSDRWYELLDKRQANEESIIVIHHRIQRIERLLDSIENKDERKLIEDLFVKGYRFRDVAESLNYEVPTIHNFSENIIYRIAVRNKDL